MMKLRVHFCIRFEIVLTLLDTYHVMFNISTIKYSFDEAFQYYSDLFCSERKTSIDYALHEYYAIQKSIVDAFGINISSSYSITYHINVNGLCVGLPQFESIADTSESIF